METNAREITLDIDRTATTVGETLGQSNSIMIENRRNLLQLLQNMNETSRNLKSLTEDLKRNPWKLVRKSDEAVVPQAEATAPGQPELRMKRLDKVN
jgi:ABC-type transporter Mla subunit MlaD